MKKNLLTIGSVRENGLGGTNPGRLSIIYTYLLQEYNLDFYRYISINQIGIELDEFVMIEKKRDVYINIRYPNDPNFIPKDKEESNNICLDIIHKALLRLAEQDARMDINKLEAIRNLIIKKAFCFDLIYKTTVNQNNKDFTAKIIIHPEEDSFDFYILIEQKKEEKCKLLIYKGKPTDYYIDDLFYYGRWKRTNEFIITGKRSEIEYHINADNCNIELVNVSNDKDKSPIFNLFKEKPGPTALQDYIKSLPPAVAAIITYQPN